MNRLTRIAAAWVVLAATCCAAEQPQPTTRQPTVIHAPVRLTQSFQTFEGWRLELAPDFMGDGGVILAGKQRLAHCVLRDVFIDGSKCDKPVAGVILRECSATVVDNVRVQRTQGPALVIDGGWNIDVLASQGMYCGADGESPSCVINAATADLRDPEHTPGGFWRDATNDVRFVAGRFEGSHVQLRTESATDIVVVGTKLHGDPSGRDVAGPLVELVAPRGPQKFLGVTTAHGQAPLYAIEWGPKQSGITIDPGDSDWPLDKGRALVSESGERPKGSYLRAPKWEEAK